MKDGISNIIIILFAILTMSGIGYLLYKDAHSQQKHLEKCRKECYPAQIIEQFSRKYCMCQPIINETVNEE